MGRSRTIPAPGKLTLGARATALTDLVVAGLPSPHSRRSYAKSIADLKEFLDGRPLTKTVLLEWRATMAETLSSATVNLRLNAARALIREAKRAGMIGGEEAFDLLDFEGMPHRGHRLGNWLQPAQVRALLDVHSGKSLRPRRNYCILALLIGCGLRRYELAELEVGTIQQRDGRWVLADLVGKGGRVRTVAIPDWVKRGIDAWLRESRIKEGRLIRRLTLQPEGLSEYAIWEIVRKAARLKGFKGISPHDLRRTCAKLCRDGGATVEQIQIMLGHASIQTTERYLGTTQDLRDAPNDNMGL